MRFRELEIPGAWVVDVEPALDERGLFARTFDAEAFGARGLSTGFVQASVSFNARAATLRGLHLQAEPHAEAKLVRCTAGAAFDVLVDLRPGSPAHRRWVGVELTGDNRRSVYVPRGVAHGFQTLVDGTELAYLIDAPYEPAAARGVRWDDPAFGIEWPEAPGGRTLSDRDRGHPDYVSGA